MKKSKVIIVGAGVGGLTAAVYLGKEQVDVLVMEKNDKAGGLVRSFERDGFLFDSGPRAFVNSGMLLPMLANLGIQLDTIENKISLAIEDQRMVVESLDSIQQYEAMMLQLFPEDQADIKMIMKIIHKLSKDTKVLYAFDNPIFVDYTQDKTFLLTKLMPWTFQLLFTLMKFKFYRKPMEDYLHAKTDNQSLIDMLTQFFFKATPTSFALGYFHVWLDYFYVLGGTGELPKQLQKKVDANEGTTIRYNTTIVNVVPAQKKVVDQYNNEYEYDYLIWASDLKSLYQNLNLEGLSEIQTNNIKKQQQKIIKAKPAESVFISYFTIDLDPSYFKQRSEGHAFYTHSKQGLGLIHHHQLEQLKTTFHTKTKEEVFAWVDAFCKYNTFEISMPVLRDPSCAPDGKTGMMVSCLFDYELTKLIEEAGWITEFKERMETNILRLLSISFYPKLNEHILFQFSSTPLTIAKTINSTHGAIVGWSFEGKAPVPSEILQLTKSATTPIPDVYQAGQWAYAPAGVPIAMYTGYQASQDILKAMYAQRKSIN